MSNPMINNPMINNPLMNNPLMNNPMINNPAMNNPMMNNLNQNNPMMNNNMNNPMMNNMPMNMFIHMINNMNLIFKYNEFGEKNLYRNILKVDDKFFVVVSSKHKREINDNNIKHYIYLSLFDFNNMEEITKIEIDCLEIQDGINTYQIEFNPQNNNIKLKVTIGFMTKIYSLKFINNELLLEQ